MIFFVLVLLLGTWEGGCFKLIDYAHYLDYIPYRQEGLAGFEDFRTNGAPPTLLRNRKMEVGTLGGKVAVEDVLLNALWPKTWPYGPEDFRPQDYTRDEVMNCLIDYSYSQSLIAADHVTIIPGIFRIPIRRHWVLPKDKLAFADHLQQYFSPGAKVLELFSVYESILPSRVELGPTVGVGFYGPEMKANPALDDYIVQDISVDPYLPLADNYFDFVVVPANFQLLQRPKEMFQEINRVLKPGGMAICGMKLGLWSFLGQKQCRYYAETNYLEDVLALGSFFHYAGGFTKPQAYDLTLPELNIVGKMKDVFFPQPRLDFFACVQAKKKKDSPHGRDGDTKRYDSVPDKPVEKGIRYKPRILPNLNTEEDSLTPYY